MRKIIPKKDQIQDLATVSEILNSKDNEAVQKFNSLNFQQQLELVLDTTGKERLELLYLSDCFNSLVQAMPAPEILFTYEEVGMDAALPIIAATSHEQFTFLTDILCWNKDEIDPSALIGWLQILAECGDSKIQDWLAKVESELFILILKTLVKIDKCDEEGNPPEFLQSRNIFTIDGMYYFEFLYTNAIDPLQTILSIFRDEDPDGFRGIMEAVIWIDQCQIEIYTSYFRQSRLSEWGFPELEEAMEIYQYFAPKEREKVIQELEKGLSEWAELDATPRYPIKLKDQNGFLSISLRYVENDRRLARFSHELVLIANKVQVADGIEDFSFQQNISIASQKTTGYVTLGLAELSNSDPIKAAELIGRVHTERLFQVGFSQVEDLARKARRLAEKPERFNQLHSTDREILKGLLSSKPKFYTGDKSLTVENYIDFQEPEQIQECQKILKRIEQL